MHGQGKGVGLAACDRAYILCSSQLSSNVPCVFYHDSSIWLKAPWLKTECSPRNQKQEPWSCSASHSCIRIQSSLSLYTGHAAPATTCVRISHI
eukprot:863246-Pelagomonas_calceolata.AAC.2